MEIVRQIIEITKCIDIIYNRLIGLEIDGFTDNWYLVEELKEMKKFEKQLYDKLLEKPKLIKLLVEESSKIKEGCINRINYHIEILINQIAFKHYKEMGEDFKNFTENMLGGSYVVVNEVDRAYERIKSLLIVCFLEEYINDPLYQKFKHHLIASKYALSQVNVDLEDEMISSEFKVPNEINDIILVASDLSKLPRAVCIDYIDQKLLQTIYKTTGSILENGVEINEDTLINMAILRMALTLSSSDNLEIVQDMFSEINDEKFQTFINDVLSNLTYYKAKRKVISLYCPQ